MTMYVGHIISLLIYVAVIATVINCYVATHRVHMKSTFGLVVYTFLMSLFLQASAFLMLQVDWVFNNYNGVVGDATAYGWLAYDYFNGFALLSFATGLKIYLKWRKNEDEEGRAYRRRSEDQP